MRFAPLVGPVLLASLAACGGGGGGSGGGGFATMQTARILVDDVEFEAWLAESPSEHARGLMGATESDLEPLPDGTPRGMLFVFPVEDVLSFWMRGTGVPLDLAYATSDGTIVEVHALAPYDETPVVSGEPVLYAFEALAGTFDLHGIGPGSVIAP